MTAAGQDGSQELRAALPAVAARLPAFLPAQRWFGGKEHAVNHVEIRDTAIIPDHPGALLAVVTVHSVGQAAETYFLPLGLTDTALADSPGEMIARYGDQVVRDAILDPDTCRALLTGMLDGRTLPTAQGGRFVFQPTPRPTALTSAGTVPSGAAHDDRLSAGLDLDTIPVRHAGVEQSNSSVIFGSAFILKALRRLAPGLNPEIEIPRFLGQFTSFDRAPALLGWAEYQAPDGSSAPVGVLQRFVPNQGDGWSYVLRRVTEAPASKPGSYERREPPSPAHGGGRGDQGASWWDARRVGGGGLEQDIAALGRTLGGLHLALASRADVPDFAPEPISEPDLIAWKRRTRASLEQILARVEHGLRDGPADTGWSAQDREYGMTVRAGADRLRAIVDGIDALADGRVVKTRHHGDFHLGQTLVASDGWIIIDFEGEPLRSLEERRAKQTPLRDVAGLLRSLDYARATAARQSRSALPLSAPERGPGGEIHLDALFVACRKAMLTAYVATVRAGGAPLLPASSADLSRALLALEVEKALYELAYELGNRPDWVSIPLSALARLAQSA